MSEAPSLDERFSHTVAAVNSLTRGLRFPEHFKQKDAKKQGGEFDPGSYFTVLKHIRLERGILLDYVYHFDGSGGYPVLYTRKAGDPSFESESALLGGVRVKARLDEVESLLAEHRKTVLGLDPLDKASRAQAATDLERKLADIPERKYQEWHLDHIETDGSPDGYLELVVYKLMAGRFYRYWHAHRPDDRIMPDRVSLDEVFEELKLFRLDVPVDLRKDAEKMDYQPTVSIGKDSAKVSFVIFTKWGGFQRRVYSVPVQFPHRIVEEASRVLLPYNCMMRF